MLDFFSKQNLKLINKQKTMNAILGIDVSKGYSDFSLLDENKQPLEKVFQLDDNRKGHDALEKLLLSKIKEHGISMLYCGVESTGGFENNWYNTLCKLSKTMNLKVVRLNPSGVKSNIAAGLNRNVTDSLSSRYIAEYLVDHPEKVEYNKEDNQYSSFRSMHKHIRLLNKQQTQLVNEMKMILYSSFPELMRYCKGSMPLWILEILKRYPTAGQVSKLKAQQLVKIKNVTQDKAEIIITKAKSSVASRTNDTQAFLIKSIANQILSKKELITEHKEFLSENCKGQEVTLLTSIKGIGNYSAAAIMIEIEDITRFESPKKLASYFGLHPELKDSGDKQSVHRMSKKGRASMRATLYMCAQTAVVYDEHFKKIYHNHRSKGKKHKQAIGVIMHKILRVVWGVLTSNKPYNSSVDKANQEKKVVAIKDESKSKETKAKRRYQELDTEAPITRKQNKIRKVQLDSQVELVEQNTGCSNYTDAKI